MLIKKQNRLINEKCYEVTSFFGRIRIKSVILKGQGIAQLYAIEGKPSN